MGDLKELLSMTNQMSLRGSYWRISSLPEPIRNGSKGCAVKGGAFQWVQVPPGETLQPEATGAVMEVTKWLKPSV